MLLFGLDSGTTACKGLVFDADTGKVFARASARHMSVAGLLRGHLEQDPHRYGPMRNGHDIARALTEGIVIGPAPGMNRPIGLGIKAKGLRITRGGAKCASMRQIVADIFGLPVIGLNVAEGGPPGAAISGGRLIIK